MTYDILYHILGTVLAYYEQNKSILTTEQIKDIAEQTRAITRQMRACREV